MRPRQPISWLFFWLSAAVAIAFFVVPAFIIQPFRRQAPGALNLALVLRQKAPWVTLLALLVCLICAYFLWQWDNLRRKIILVSVLAPSVFCAVMSRLNYFEWMFHPIDSPKFEAEAASKLDPAQMILAVRFADDARAYPISQMAYHHILNDVIAGVPIAVTY